MGNDPNDLKAVMAGSRELDKGSDPSDGSVSSVMARELYPMFAASGQAIVKDEAVRQLTRCGVELYEIKARTGRFPPALGPKDRWAIDPWTDRVFVYKPGRSKFALYGVGANKTDDGGERGNWGASPSSDDVEFRAPRP